MQHISLRQHPGNVCLFFLSKHSMNAHLRMTLLLKYALFWGVTQCMFVVVYRSIGTAYRSHIQVLNSQRSAWPLNMGLTELFRNVLNILDCVWNMMAHAQKPDFVFRRNGRVYLNRRGRRFSWLLAAEECASTVVMLDTPCSEVVWRVLATHSIRQFPLRFLSLRHRVPSHFNWNLPPV